MKYKYDFQAEINRLYTFPIPSKASTHKDLTGF